MARRALLSLAVLVAVATSAAAVEKPWEVRVDLPVPVPLALPDVLPTNPFSEPAATVPVVRTATLRDKFEDTFPVRAASYVDASGKVRRVVFVDLPLPGLDVALRETIKDVDFTPGRSYGGTVPTWVDLDIDLAGRIDGGKVITMLAAAPDPEVPPVAETAGPPIPEDNDLNLPATPVDRLEQAPAPRRFRAKASGREFRQDVRLLVEVSAAGRCERVVFLSVPSGLQRWLLASMSSWSFQPALGENGPTSSWVIVEGTIEVDMGTLRADSIRVRRESSYPRGPAAPASDPPPGG